MKNNRELGYIKVICLNFIACPYNSDLCTHRKVHFKNDYCRGTECTDDEPCIEIEIEEENGSRGF